MRRAMDSVFVHLVWAPWDRAPLLIGDTRKTAYRAIGGACAALNAQVIALGGVTDHVHLLVQLPTTLSVATLVKEVKGSSGHMLARRAMASDLFFKWQGSYGAFSVSPHELDVVANYIRRQEEHHALNDTVARWELPEPPEPPTPRDD